jgi:integrase
MEGHVRKRGGKWYFSYEASNVEGKRKRIERVGGRTKKEAEAALRKALLEYENAGMHFQPAEISVADYLDYWYKNHVLINCKPYTQSSYEVMIRRHFKPALGIYKLKALTPSILQEFANEKYLSSIAKNTLYNILGVLSGALKYAVHPCGFIKDNPMQYVKRPKYDHDEGQQSHVVISTQDLQSIIERFPLGSSYFIPIMIGYYAGCRIGEVMSLTWDDVDLDKGTISISKNLIKHQSKWYIGTTKTKASTRTIKIGSSLQDALRQHRKLQMERRLEYGPHYLDQYVIPEPDPSSGKPRKRIHLFSASKTPKGAELLKIVCTQESGKMVTQDIFKYAAKVIHQSLKIKFTFHSLRHTHATMLIENGANIKGVQARLGHANIQTTLDAYTHATEIMANQSVEIFESAAKQNLS